MLKKIVFFAFLLLVVKVFSEEKIAYFNSSEVIKIMPEYIRMQDSIQKTQVAIQSEMAILEEEYKKKYEAFMGEVDKLVESIKNRRMQEIKDIEERAGIFQEQSQKQLQQLYERLLAPIQRKVKDAVKAVGTEHNFTYILEESGLLYISPSAVNAAPFIKKKLGLK